MRFRLFIYFVFAILVAGMFSCEDDSISDDPSLRFSYSADTVFFDTVFSGEVSSVRRFMIYNTTDENLKFDRICLMSDDENYRININGQSGKCFDNLTLKSGDSLFVFINAKLTTSGRRNPDIILDSLMLSYNGNSDKILLAAYCFDAVVLKNYVVKKDEVFTKDKPYLIYDTLKVADGSTLTVDAGSALYFKSGAYFVIDGSLVVNGIASNPVVIQGSRFDNLYAGLPYERLASQWGGIRITEKSSGNYIKGARIKGGVYGITVDSSAIDSSKYRLIIANSHLTTNKKGVLNSDNARIYSYNTVFANGGTHTVQIKGGSALFNHCTIAEYSNNSRFFSAFVVKSDSINKSVDVELNNSIVYGSYRKEFDLEDNTSHKFNNCLLKGIVVESENFISTMWNKEPNFSINTDDFIYDFHIDSLSAAIDSANVEIIKKYKECEYDLDGNSRLLDGLPDIGAYEYLKNY